MRNDAGNFQPRRLLLVGEILHIEALQIDEIVLQRVVDRVQRNDASSALD